MHVVLVNSSGRKNGNTAEILLKFREALELASFTVEAINVADYSIKTCLGCRVCFDKGENACPLKDELLGIHGKLEAADLVIMGSPVYVEDVNGVMKNLIDRLAFNSHRPHFGGKKAYVLCTSGIGSTRHTLTTMARALRTWGFTLLGSSRYRCGAKIERENAERLYGKKIHSEVSKIQAGMKRNGVSFYSLLYFTVQKWYYEHKTDTDSFDYMYWKQHGWLTKEATFFALPIRGFSVLLARTLSRFISLFLK